MVFEDSFFEDEIREGFYVPAIMKRAWAAQLEVLEAIDKICKKHNIQYFAQWGTLLGAVRHHGFIPWDDDLDIGMKRPDYDKFVRVAPQEFSGEYNYLNFSQDEEFGDFLTRVLNTRRIHLDDEFLEEFHQFPYVAGVDIFPWDYINPDKKKDKEQRLLIQIVNSTAESLHNGAELSEAKKNLCEIQKLCNVRFNNRKPIVCQLKELADRLCGMNTYEEADNITLMPRRVNGSKYCFPKDYFDNFIMMPFENISIPVPLEYDAILKKNYGKYMMQVRGWESHNYPFFAGMEENLERICEMIPYEYKVPKYDQLVQLRMKRCPKKQRTYQQALDIVDLMITAQNEAITLIELGTIDEGGQILVECQSAAISVGSLLEQQYENVQKSGLLVIVKRLEDYCEKVYQLHKILDNNTYDLQEMLEKNIQQLLSDIQFKINELTRSEKKKIVFLVYRSKFWKTYDGLWREKIADKNNDVKVIPIPYYNKTFKRKLLNLHCDSTGYPDEVQVTDWRAYDFENERPDEVYIQNPYDEYDCAYSVHPFFYASNLRKYTDRLICVPALVPDAYELRDERAVKMMRYYVRTPGVMLADKVLVKSDKLQLNYVAILTEVLGKISEKLWNDVVEVNNLIGDNEEIGFRSIPDDWEKHLYGPDGKRKVVLLYNVGLSQMLHEKDRMITKIENTFFFLKKHREDVLLLWYNEEDMLRTIQLNNQELWDKYCKLILQYKSENWGLFAEDDQEKLAFSLADVFYGDSGRMMERFFADDKPVLCQNVRYDNIL